MVVTCDYLQCAVYTLPLNYSKTIKSGRVKSSVHKNKFSYATGSTNKNSSVGGGDGWGGTIQYSTRVWREGGSRSIMYSVYSYMLLKKLWFHTVCCVSLSGLQEKYNRDKNNLKNFQNDNKNNKMTTKTIAYKVIAKSDNIKL